MEHHNGNKMRMHFRELEFTKIPFMMFSYCKKNGGTAYENINFGP
jgi:hypothetical protein